MAIEHNIESSDEWFLGEDKSLIFTIYQSDGSTAQNIAGWSMSWMLKRHRDDEDAEALITKTTSSGIALTTPASGICTVTVADTDTETSPEVGEGNYFHELKRTDAGFETVLSFGRCRLRRGVHRS